MNKGFEFKIFGSIFLILSLFFCSHEALAFSGSGAGNIGSPYVVTSCTQLEEMKDSLSSDYVLGNDFDCAGFNPGGDGKGFIPVGNSVTPFTGTLDGAGFTISNLTINRPLEDNVGLFGYVNGGTFTDLNISGSMTGKTYIGGLAGEMHGTILVDSVTSAVNVTTVFSYGAGGLIGGIDSLNTVTITNSHATGNVTDTDASSGAYVGGLIGFDDANDSTITDSSASGDVIVNSQSAYEIGGLVGEFYGSAITNSSFTGSVNVNAGDGSVQYGVAGLVGYTSYQVTITDCFVTGNVTVVTTDEVDYGVGGLVGLSDDYLYIVSSYFEGDLSVTAGTYVYEGVGGLVGKPYFGGSIDSSHVKGDITVNANSVEYGVGGLSGYNGDILDITASYYRGDISVTSADDVYEGVGGLAGYYYYAGNIDNSYAVGSIDINAGYLDYGVGGLIGYKDDDMTITDSFAHMDISVTTTSDYIIGVGGVLGYSDGIYISDVSSSWASGNIVLNSVTYIYTVGGLLGHTASENISDSFASYTFNLTSGTDDITYIGAIASDNSPNYNNVFYNSTLSNPYICNGSDDPDPAGCTGENNSYFFYNNSGDSNTYTYADTASASSEYDNPHWAATQSTGRPNVASCSDNIHAWAPLSKGVNPEWLQVGYNTPAKSTGVSIHESNIGSFITQVDFIDTDDVSHTVWTGTDSTVCGDYFETTFPETVYLVKAVKIYTAVAGWEEVDSVRLIVASDPVTPPADSLFGAWDFNNFWFSHAGFFPTLIDPSLQIEPIVTTGSASSITDSTATLHAVVDDEGFSPVTERGFQYDLTTDYKNSVSENVSGVGAYSLNLSGLNGCSSTYYYRAYAVNDFGISYGSGDTFVTDGGGSSAPNDPTFLTPVPYIDGSWGNDNTPTLDFDISAGGACSSDNVKYRIQIDDTSNFSSPLVDYTSALGTVGSFSFTVGQAVGGGVYAVGSGGQTLPDSSSYYWRVKAIDDADNESGYSVAHSGDVAFRIDTLAPTAGSVVAVDRKISSISVKISGYSDSGSGLSVSPFLFRNITNTTDSGQVSSDSWTSSSLFSDHPYSFSTVVSDLAGNSSSTPVVSIKTNHLTGNTPTNNELVPLVVFPPSSPPADDTLPPPTPSTPPTNPTPPDNTPTIDTPPSTDTPVINPPITTPPPTVVVTPPVTQQPQQFNHLVKVVTAEIKVLINNKIVRTFSQLAIAIPLAASTILLDRMIGSGVSMLNLLSYLFFLIPQLLRWKKTPKPWGVVYDSVTKRPLAFAKVSVLSGEQRILETTITDINGRYGFLVAEEFIEGNDRQIEVKVEKLDYVFPSTETPTENEQILYPHVYQGGFVRASRETTNFDIPMDPVSEKKYRMIPYFGIVSVTLNNVWVDLTNILFVIGLLLGFTSYILDPKAVNLIPIGLILITTILRITGFTFKSFGRTIDKQTKQPLPFGFIALHTRDGERINFTVSDSLGRYFLLSPKGSFILKAYTPSHISPMRTSEISLKTKKGWISREVVV